MTRTEIIDKIKKIQALAKEGVAGEMNNAKAKLEKMMRDYGITDQDLEETEKTDFYMIDARKQAQLAVQIIHTFISPKMKIYDIAKMKATDRKWLCSHGHGSFKANIAVDCTRGEYIQILFLYETFIADWDKQFSAFEYAYFSANNLLPKADETDGKGKDVPDDVVKQAYEMRDTIRKKNVYKALKA